MLTQQQQVVDQGKQQCDAPRDSGDCETPIEQLSAAVGSRRKAPEGQLEQEHKRQKQLGTGRPADFTGPPGSFQHNRGPPPAMLAEFKEWVWAALELSEGRLELSEIGMKVPDSLKPYKKVSCLDGCVCVLHMPALLRNADTPECGVKSRSVVQEAPSSLKLLRVAAGAHNRGTLQKKEQSEARLEPKPVCQSTLNHCRDADHRTHSSSKDNISHLKMIDCLKPLADEVLEVNLVIK